jgi:hypothetical protein
VFLGVCVQCPRCGDFVLIGLAMTIITTQGDNERHRRAVTSYAIRRMQRPGAEPPALFEDDLRAIWRENRLPSPQQQCELLILLLGERQPSWTEPVIMTPEQLEGEIGAALRPHDRRRGWAFVTDHLIQLGLITLTGGGGGLPAHLELTRFRGARQAFNGGFSDAQDAPALFT